MPQTASRVTIQTPVTFNDDLPDAVDVVIIGGGVIGVFTALYLARMGQSVFLCEKGRIAGEQSSRNWGWIRQQGRDPAELPIMMKSLELWKEVDRETGGQCGVRTCGTYYLASSQSSLDEYNDWLPVAHEYGVDTRLLGRKEIEKAFSGQAKPGWLGGIVTPGDARGEPWRAVPVVARLAHEAGVSIREDCAVRALDVEAGRVTGVITERGRIRCGQLVLAAGAWSSLFAQRHGLGIPQLAVHGTVAQTGPMPEFFSGAATDEELAIRRRDDDGYTLSLADSHGFFLGPDAFRHFYRYLPILRKSWRSISVKLKAPSGYPDAWTTSRDWSETEISPFEVTRVLEPTPDQKSCRQMQDRFEARFRDIGRPKILSAWAGMIDALPDIVPVVDHVSSMPGLIIATGMSGHGFGIGPGFGHVVAQLVCGEQPEFDLQRFRFDRFSDGSILRPGPAL